MGREFAAFISYASRPEVGLVEKDLARLATSRESELEVGVEAPDPLLVPGQSWVAQLQAGFGQADRLILVVTPEALASPRVADEVEPFVAEVPGWVFRDRGFRVLAPSPQARP